MQDLRAMITKLLTTVEEPQSQLDMIRDIKKELRHKFHQHLMEELTFDRT